MSKSKLPNARYEKTQSSFTFYSSSSLLESYAIRLSRALGLDVAGGPSTFGFLLSSLLPETCGRGSSAFRFPVAFEPSTCAAAAEIGWDDDDDADDVEDAGEGLSRLTNPAKSDAFFLGADVVDPPVNVDDTFALDLGAIDPDSDNNGTGGGGADLNFTVLGEGEEKKGLGSIQMVAGGIVLDMMNKGTRVILHAKVLQFLSFLLCKLLLLLRFIVLQCVQKLEFVVIDLVNEVS